MPERRKASPRNRENRSRSLRNLNKEMAANVTAIVADATWR
jgi:hypothetical protein